MTNRAARVLSVGAVVATLAACRKESTPRPTLTDDPLPAASRSFTVAPHVPTLTATVPDPLPPVKRGRSCHSTLPCPNGEHCSIQGDGCDVLCNSRAVCSKVCTAGECLPGPAPSGYVPNPL